MTPRNISIITGVATLACRPPSSSPCSFILTGWAHDNARSLKLEERPMVDERPRLTASEIEQELLADAEVAHTAWYSIRNDLPLQRPEELDMGAGHIEPEVGPEQGKFADVTHVVALLQQLYDLDLSPPPPA